MMNMRPVVFKDIYSRRVLLNTCLVYLLFDILHRSKRYVAGFSLFEYVIIACCVTLACRIIYNLQVHLLAVYYNVCSCLVDRPNISVNWPNMAGLQLDPGVLLLIFEEQAFRSSTLKRNGYSYCFYQ